MGLWLLVWEVYHICHHHIGAMVAQLVSACCTLGMPGLPLHCPSLIVAVQCIGGGRWFSCFLPHLTCTVLVQPLTDPGCCRRTHYYTTIIMCTRIIGFGLVILDRSGKICCITSMLVIVCFWSELDIKYMYEISNHNYICK